MLITNTNKSDHSTYYDLVTDGGGSLQTEGAVILFALIVLVIGLTIVALVNKKVFLRIVAGIAAAVIAVSGSVLLAHTISENNKEIMENSVAIHSQNIKFLVMNQYKYDIVEESMFTTVKVNHGRATVTKLVLKDVLEMKDKDGNIFPAEVYTRPEDPSHVRVIVLTDDLQDVLKDSKTTAK